MNEFEKRKAMKAVKESDDNQDNTLVSVRDMLVSMIEDIDSGDITANKMVAILVQHDEDTGTDFDWRHVNVDNLEVVGILAMRQHFHIRNVTGDE